MGVLSKELLMCPSLTLEGPEAMAGSRGGARKKMPEDADADPAALLVSETPELGRGRSCKPTLMRTGPFNAGNVKET